MKLKKKELIRAVRSGLEALGYTYLRDSLHGNEGFFAKKINDKYYLTLGLTIHRFYDDAFTGDFYLATNLSWAASGRDFPWLICYKRIGQYLTKDEIALLKDKDDWWSGKDPESVEEFVSMVALTEPRFLATPDLFQEVDKSVGIARITKIVNLVIELVLKGDDIEFDFKNLPNREIDGIPMIWFKAAEKVINDIDYPNKTMAAVKIYASDAYHQTMLEKKEKSL